jgi:hypothetical protein
LRQAANAVSYATLKADKAGIVTAVTGEPGQVVSPGQAVITLAEAGATEIAVAVPEQDAGRIAVGQHVTITLWAGPRAGGTAGRIRDIAGQADAASRTYAVRVAVASPPESMRLGMTSTVAVRIDEGAAGMLVPLTALAEVDGAPVVFVVDAGSKTVRRTRITVAGTADEGVRVAGDRRRAVPARRHARPATRRAAGPAELMRGRSPSAPKPQNVGATPCLLTEASARASPPAKALLLSATPEARGLAPSPGSTSPPGPSRMATSLPFSSFCCWRPAAMRSSRSARRRTRTSHSG